MMFTSSSGVIRLHDYSHIEDMVNWRRYCLIEESFYPVIDLLRTFRQGVIPVLRRAILSYQ